MTEAESSDRMSQTSIPSAHPAAIAAPSAVVSDIDGRMVFMPAETSLTLQLSCVDPKEEMNLKNSK